MAPLSDTDTFVSDEDLNKKPYYFYIDRKSHYLHKCFHAFTLFGEDFF